MAKLNLSKEDRDDIISALRYRAEKLANYTTGIDEEDEEAAEMVHGWRELANAIETSSEISFEEK